MQIRYMKDLEAGTRSAIGSVNPAPFFAEYNAQGNPWAVFNTFPDAVADTVAAPVAAKYAGVLAAADVSPKTTPGRRWSPCGSTWVFLDRSAFGPDHRGVSPVRRHRGSRFRVHMRVRTPI